MQANVPVIQSNTIQSESNTNMRFTPPVLEEVKQYCHDRNNQVNPEAFFDFYSSKGWMVGKNKMRDWKAAVRTWEKNERPRKTNPALKYEQTPINEDEFNKLVVDLGGEA